MSPLSFSTRNLETSFSEAKSASCELGFLPSFCKIVEASVGYLAMNSRSGWGRDTAKGLDGRQESRSFDLTLSESSSLLSLMPRGLRPHTSASRDSLSLTSLSEWSSDDSMINRASTSSSLPPRETCQYRLCLRSNPNGRRFTSSVSTESLLTIWVLSSTTLSSSAWMWAASLPSGWMLAAPEPSLAFIMAAGPTRATSDCLSFFSSL
mmetsp:Transcript_10181/g.35172  ORF Transcript_10181/g.35172 Transcript_10181/m.35172 type:complete len:208 (-) Transcript_10181:2232-2855(-)